MFSEISSTSSKDDQLESSPGSGWQNIMLIADGSFSGVEKNQLVLDSGDEFVSSGKGSDPERDHVELRDEHSDSDNERLSVTFSDPIDRDPNSGADDTVWQCESVKSIGMKTSGHNNQTQKEVLSIRSPIV